MTKTRDFVIPAVLALIALIAIERLSFNKLDNGSGPKQLTGSNLVK